MGIHSLPSTPTHEPSCLSLSKRCWKKYWTLYEQGQAGKSRATLLAIVTFTFLCIFTRREREREREPIESNRVVDFCSLGELETGACSTGATSAKSPCNVHNSQITSTTHILCLVIKELLFTVLFSNKIRCTTFS